MSFRSSLGSLLSLAVFATARRFCDGFALPTFLLLLFACSYAWAFVLRVPELSKPLLPDGPRPPPPQPSAAAGQPPQRPPPAEAEPQRRPQPEAAAAADDELPQPRRPVAAGSATAVREPAAAERSAAAEEASPVDVADRPLAAASPASSSAAPFPDAAAPSVPSAVAPATAAGSAAPIQTRSEAAAQPLRPAASCADGEAPVACADTAERAAVEEGKRPRPAGEEVDDASSQGEADRGEDENDLADLPKAQELRLQGNELFKAGKLHDAREAYSEAIHLMPLAEKKERAVLHCNRAACLQKLSRWDEVVNDCRQAVELDPEYAKAYLRRSSAYEVQSKWNDAFEDLKKAVELEPALRGRESRRLAMLEKKAQEQFEKDKDEMLGKLKDLGNTILGKFGMSVDNFKMEQDPDTGSYSIKYQT